MRYIKGDFFQVPNRKALFGLKPRAQVVFMSLCSYSDKEGQCFPALTTLARRCAMGRSTVITALDELIQAGLIEKIGQKGRANHYQIMIIDTRPKSGLVQNLDGGSSKSGRVPVLTLHGNNIHDNNMNINNNPSGGTSENPVKIPDPINTVLSIDFFRQQFPSDFSGPKNVFAIPAVRELVKANLAVYSQDEILRLLTAYEPRMNEKFAPSPGKSVYGFFMDNKLSAIRKFVDSYDETRPGQVRGYKKAYGKPISSKDQEIVDIVRESMRKQKEGK